MADARASDLTPLGALTKLTKLHITGLQLGAGSTVSIEPLSALQVATWDARPCLPTSLAAAACILCGALDARKRACPARMRGVCGAVAVEPRGAQGLGELSLYGSTSIIDGVPLGKLVSLKGLDLTARSALQSVALGACAASGRAQEERSWAEIKRGRERGGERRGGRSKKEMRADSFQHICAAVHSGLAEL